MIRKFSPFTLVVTMLLTACYQPKQDYKEMGFASAEEMKGVQAQGWHTKARFELDNPHKPINPPSTDGAVRALVAEIEKPYQEAKNYSISDGSEGKSWFHETDTTVNGGCQIQIDSTIKQNDPDTGEWTSTVFVRIVYNLPKMDSAKIYNINDYDFGPNGGAVKKAHIASGDVFVVSTSGQSDRIQSTSNIRTKYDPTNELGPLKDFSLWFDAAKTQSEAERIRALYQNAIDACKA
jgi:hypothetical protein